MIVSKAVKMAGVMNVPVLGLVENMSMLFARTAKEISVFGGQSSGCQEFACGAGCLPIDPN